MLVLKQSIAEGWGEILLAGLQLNRAFPLLQHLNPAFLPHELAFIFFQSQLMEQNKVEMSCWVWKERPATAENFIDGITDEVDLSRIFHSNLSYQHISVIERFDAANNLSLATLVPMEIIGWNLTLSSRMDLNQAKAFIGYNGSTVNRSSSLRSLRTQPFNFKRFSVEWKAESQWRIHF